MGTNTGHVMTLANSIIGVSVLAMPFCFKQCGIILATLMLILSSIMTRLACYYLIKSAILARRRNFEFLAFHIFGPPGKLTVELSIIGFMLGTCVAFFVVVGDLGPAILGPILGIENPQSIRATVLIGIAVFVVLPLGLLRNVDSLSAISAATIAFYICLVLKVMGEATTHLVAWDWVDHVYLWRPAGLLQCIPIFSMALSCQTQLFEIFESIPNGTLDKMTVIVRSAVNLCTLMYVAMGCFGYIAFCTQPFSGNLMLSFSPTPTSEVIKMGFVLSVAVSFPLVIFPCRASLHSLLFRRGIPPHHELLSVSNHMPELRFKCITIVIVAIALVSGLLIPNIELVLGLVGSTIGVLICVIIPATFFLCLTTKNNNERLLAQILFVTGLMIMVLGSYANLYATEQAISNNEPPSAPKLVQLKPPEMPSVNVLPPDTKSQIKMKDDTLKNIQNVEQLAAALPKLQKDNPAPSIEKIEEKQDVRKEPPVPEAPEVKVVSEGPPEVKVAEAQVPAVQEVKKLEPPAEIEKTVPKKEESIHNDAFKKEDDEIKEVQKQEILKKKEELIEKLEENEEKQKKLLEEQKKILQDIKLEKEKLVGENKQLENIEKGKEIEKNQVKSHLTNEVIDEKKEAPIVIVKKVPEIAEIKNTLEAVEPKIVKKIEQELKEPIKLIKDDVVKKNMADGLPLPLAVQHIVPALKPAKIVDNNLINPDEGNPDSKVLRREILGNSQVREQREKRDVIEVSDIDLKEEGGIKIDNTIPTTSVKNLEKKTPGSLVQPSNSVIIGHVQVKPVVIELIPPKSEVISGKDIEKGNDSWILGKDVKIIASTNEVKDAVKDQGNEIQSKELKEVMEECQDKKKPAMKFTDELKPLDFQKFDKETKDLVNPSAEKEVLNVNGEEKDLKLLNVNKEETTESIIKFPAFLSNPNLVLPSDKLENAVLENNAINNAAKPMKRDLKSLDLTENQNSKEGEA
ncbi:putative sodium-coupled neutral amino acid transporter 10 isoform X2 [Macrosteles quadrilineatus]|nr:putative sodium-coupled neutral amino acid transporter 10 isoform X2 [Macrosteles quadrilineatus]XP_054285559.1 putative sodium-coupled neutral amino acid transporter 10 isoform X2 [Macrosteles quadrilineatus]